MCESQGQCYLLFSFVPFVFFVDELPSPIVFACPSFRLIEQRLQTEAECRTGSIVFILGEMQLRA